MSLLSVNGLNVHYDLPRKSWFGPRPRFHAVKNVSIDVEAGEVVSLVGESGSGKSTTARCIIGLVPASSGSISIADKKLVEPADWAQPRRVMQMIFQDPYASLDPRLTAAAIISEPLKNFNIVKSNKEALHRSAALMERVGLEPQMLLRYPHEFSGGQRQRIGIARALAADPKLLLCDEPVSALDVSVQAQIINLLDDLRRDLNIGLLFIAHDLAVVRHLSDRVAVMHNGAVVEAGTCAEIFTNPQHDYTKSLLASVPEPVPELARAMIDKHR